MFHPAVAKSPSNESDLGRHPALVASAPVKRRKTSSVTRHSPARHLRYTSRAKREADVSLSHHRTGINGCSPMAHPLTHLTHGIPTRRPFHPAKTARRLLSEVASPSSSRQDAPSRYRVGCAACRSELPRERFSPLTRSGPAASREFAERGILNVE